MLVNKGYERRKILLMWEATDIFFQTHVLVDLWDEAGFWKSIETICENENDAYMAQALNLMNSHSGIAQW